MESIRPSAQSPAAHSAEPSARQAISSSTRTTRGCYVVRPGGEGMEAVVGLGLLSGPILIVLVVVVIGIHVLVTT